MIRTTWPPASSRYTWTTTSIRIVPGTAPDGAPTLFAVLDPLDEQDHVRIVKYPAGVFEPDPVLTLVALVFPFVPLELHDSS